MEKSWHFVTDNVIERVFVSCGSCKLCSKGQQKLSFDVNEKKVCKIRGNKTVGCYKTKV